MAARIKRINHNKNPIFFCGDDRGSLAVYVEGAKQHCINGLPINDEKIPKILEKWKKLDVIFFSCSYPLMGCKEIENIKNIHSRTISNRLIPYRHRTQNRGFFLDDYWKSLSPEDIDFLFKNWSEMLGYYYLEYPNIVLLPLACHYFDQILELPNKSMEIISQFEKRVDLSPLDKFNKNNYLNDLGILSKTGFSKIRKNIFSYINN